VSPDRWTARVGPSTTYIMDRVVRRMDGGSAQTDAQR
jgi:hypothetical protein